MGVFLWGRSKKRGGCKERSVTPPLWSNGGPRAGLVEVGKQEDLTCPSPGISGFLICTSRWFISMSALWNSYFLQS